MNTTQPKTPDVEPVQKQFAGRLRQRSVALVVVAVLFAMAHYAFGEWVFHPHIALGREKLFWSGFVYAGLLPLVNFFVWQLLARQHVNPARCIFLIHAATAALDCVWYPVWRSGNILEWKLSPDYWHWWTYSLPLALAVGNAWMAWRWWSSRRGANKAIQPRPLSVVEWLLRLAAVFITAGAVLASAVHLLLPQLPVSGFTSAVAREFLLPRERHADFEFIVRQSQGRGKRLGAILDHIQLAYLQRKQFSAECEASVFQEFILSPQIDETPVAEIDWRRPLWEFFYPRVRRVADGAGAAAIVVRHLRERVGISPAFAYRLGVEAIWTQGMTDAVGFERIYVAALRSVGVPARLDARGRTEYWDASAWRLAPRPLFESVER